MWNWNLGWIMELVETRCGIMREPRIDLELGVWLEGMWYWDIFYFVLGRNMEEGRNILGMELCRTRMWKEPRSNGKGGSYLKKLGWTLQETEREVLRTRKLGPQIILAIPRSSTRVPLQFLPISSQVLCSYLKYPFLIQDPRWLKFLLPIVSCTGLTSFLTVFPKNSLQNTNTLQFPKKDKEIFSQKISSSSRCKHTKN